jgi:hypothetical protein
MARPGTSPDSIALAAKAIAIGVISTTVWKAMLGMALGTPGFRPVIAGGLVVMDGAIGTGFVLAR